VGALRPLSPTPFTARSFVISMPHVRQEKSIPICHSDSPTDGEESIKLNLIPIIDQIKDEDSPPKNKQYQKSLVLVYIRSGTSIPNKSIPVFIILPVTAASPNLNDAVCLSVSRKIGID